LAYVRSNLALALPYYLFILLTMEKTYNITWLVLILLTIVSTLFANSEIKYFAIIILGLSFLKFIGVAFYFMELKKANYFWKVLLICFVGLLFLAVAII
jgi:hypothetical protein